jgi:hypothetical protein
MHMSLQLFYFPWSPRNSNNWHIQFPTPDHRLQRRKDLLIREIARDPEEDKRI